MHARDARLCDGLGLGLLDRIATPEQVKREAGGERHDRQLRVDTERARYDATVGHIQTHDVVHPQVRVDHATGRIGIGTRGSEIESIR